MLASGDHCWPTWKTITTGVCSLVTGVCLLFITNKRVPVYVYVCACVVVRLSSWMSLITRPGSCRGLWMSRWSRLRICRYNWNTYSQGKEHVNTHTHGWCDFTSIMGCRFKAESHIYIWCNFFYYTLNCHYPLVWLGNNRGCKHDVPLQSISINRLKLVE